MEMKMFASSWRRVLGRRLSGRGVFGLLALLFTGGAVAQQATQLSPEYPGNAPQVAKADEKSAKSVHRLDPKNVPAPSLAPLDERFKTRGLSEEPGVAKRGDPVLPAPKKK